MSADERDEVVNFLRDQWDFSEQEAGFAADDIADIYGKRALSRAPVDVEAVRAEELDAIRDAIRPIVYRYEGAGEGAIDEIALAAIRARSTATPAQAGALDEDDAIDQIEAILQRLPRSDCFSAPSAAGSAGITVRNCTASDRLAGVAAAEEMLAQQLAKFIGYAWEGLRSDGHRVTEHGYTIFTHGSMGWSFQGTQDDLRDVARGMLRALIARAGEEG